MTRYSFGATMVGVLVLAGSVVTAQAPAPPAAGQGQGRGAAPQPPPQNLQVLPKDMARPQVVQIMQQFIAALGVTCAVCHRGAAIPVVAAGTPGAPPPPRGAGPGGAPGAAPGAGRGN